MYNLSVSLDSAIVREARFLADGEGTTLEAKVSDFLQQYTQLGVKALDVTNWQKDAANIST